MPLHRIETIFTCASRSRRTDNGQHDRPVAYVSTCTWPIMDRDRRAVICNRFFSFPPERVCACIAPAATVHILGMNKKRRCASRALNTKIDSYTRCESKRQNWKFRKCTTNIWLWDGMAFAMNETFRCRRDRRRRNAENCGDKNKSFDGIVIFISRKRTCRTFQFDLAWARP